MKPILIATIAHAINSAYCLAIGDKVAPPFAECPEDMQRGILAGVQLHLDNPDTTPEQSHESWLADKLANGWVHGEVKDLEAKTHPCCVPYAELPESQKVKDYLFRAVVHALKDIPDAGSQDADARVAELQDQLNEVLGKNAALVAQIASDGVPMLDNGVPIKYIGPRESFTDRLYGSGLMFTQGQVRSVPGDLARRFLNHRDLFERSTGPAPAGDDTKQVIAQAQQEQKERTRKEEDLSALHREVDNFADFTSLAAFAKDRYGLNLVKQHGLARSRDAVHARIDQFGGAV
ncbi:RyR domain-containing protein [Pseudomonas aeruginosa]|uniref:RyR domain-containing protein n=1 Tax=Pseudomonas aeruginosa TaxID=287 RepID=UPI001A327F3B|nr:RyR domain-containing protein [Pseudomonas aeruginosa]EKG0328536.1 acetyltransferase [Pseudomonas aeruginosa]MBI8682442.1 acetyltransferase [Pseudomonas aeruginosa]MCV4257191.1 RyR domain-containing protein [Pseudomonas aeruginosa]WCV21584.1 acetyltransferase [Pseudomonas aeruginosa]HCF3423629.1 acetyltransferase [Pseudomonas aeruginosa]